MLDGNAALLRVYLRAWETFEHAPYRAKAIDILRYVHGTLADPVDGGFFASQRADEQYYTLRSLDERRAAAAPPVDHSLYADTNASMVMAYVRGARVLDDGALLEFAIKSLERVVMETYERGGGIAHHADETTRVRGLLADQVQVSAALLDVHDATDREAYLDMAQELMYYSLRSMWGRQGGWLFRSRRCQTVGHRLATRAAQAVYHQLRSHVRPRAPGRRDPEVRVPRSRQPGTVLSDCGVSSARPDGGDLRTRGTGSPLKPRTKDQAPPRTAVASLLPGPPMIDCSARR